MKEQGHPFYGQEIYPQREQEFIEKILGEYKGQPVSEQLKQKIYDRLADEKAKGKIKIPFKVVYRNDTTGKYPPRIEILLDTKV